MSAMSRGAPASPEECAAAIAMGVRHAREGARTFNPRERTMTSRFFYCDAYDPCEASFAEFEARFGPNGRPFGLADNREVSRLYQEAFTGEVRALGLEGERDAS